MNCRACVELIQETLGRELPEVCAHHLETCPACRFEYQSLRQLHSLLRQLPAPELAPELAARLASLSLPPRQPSRPRGAWAWSGVWAALSMPALASALLLALWWNGEKLTPPERTAPPSSVSAFATPQPGPATRSPATRKKRGEAALAHVAIRPRQPVLRVDLRSMDDRDLVEQIQRLILSSGGVPEERVPELAGPPPLQQVFVIPRQKLPSIRQDLQRLHPQPLTDEEEPLPEPEEQARIILISK